MKRKFPVQALRGFLSFGLEMAAFAMISEGSEVAPFSTISPGLEGTAFPLQG